VELAGVDVGLAGVAGGVDDELGAQLAQERRENLGPRVVDIAPREIAEGEVLAGEQALIGLSHISGATEEQYHEGFEARDVAAAGPRCFCSSGLRSVVTTEETDSVGLGYLVVVGGDEFTQLRPSFVAEERALLIAELARRDGVDKPAGAVAAKVEEEPVTVVVLERPFIDDALTVRFAGTLPQAALDMKPWRPAPDDELVARRGECAELHADRTKLALAPEVELAVHRWADVHRLPDGPSGGNEQNTIARLW
jgi:hypothetical protein